MGKFFTFKSPESTVEPRDYPPKQEPPLVDLTGEDSDVVDVIKLKTRSKNSLNSEIQFLKNVPPPETIQASEPTRLATDQNEVHLLKVVNPNNQHNVDEEQGAFR